MTNVSAPPRPAQGRTATGAGSTVVNISRRVARKPLGLASFLFLAGVVVACALANWTSPYSPQANDYTAILKGPTGSHLLGTDELGRDVLSRLLYGGRPVLLATFEVVVIAVALGVTVGVAAGFWEKSADRVLSGWVNVLLALPIVVILVVVLSIFAGSLTPAVIPLGILLSAPVARVVRSATIGARHELYIDAAKVAGLPDRRIITRHILPRVAGPVIVQSTLVAAVALITLTSLGFLGLGSRPPAPSWGSMVAEAAQVYGTQPVFLLICGGLIALTVLAFGLLGDAVGDAVAERWATSGPAAPKRPGKAPDVYGITIARPPADVPDVPPVLRVEGLTVSFPWAYNGRNVVQDVSFSVAAGETLALVGESGSGKSVTARAVLGLLPAGAQVSGLAALHDRNLLALTEREFRDVRGSRIGLISQDPILSLDPCCTVGQALSAVIRLHADVTRAVARKRAVELLEQVRIKDPDAVMRRFPHQLSGGMAQRVSIARALAGNPEVLIADEPTTALDVTVQSEILELLFTLQSATGIAILLITHDWGVVATVADRAIMMYAGQVVESAPLLPLFGHQLHPYTAALLSSSPHFGPVGGRLPALPGAVPTPDEFPDGCRFSNRCALAVPECSLGPVELREVAPEHRSRCIRTDTLIASGEARS